ncbi:DUF6457 domain-containing protein [Aeromicrobium massiliense]|uniref:DUF6457 domain-containing protein n=1 Tax=Aeromicrobium massiliense TaxID=1464554 RepID=UPI0002E6C433|nr:DUF6457 domain-containing protein [Aeromicrobium massiliense]
MSDISLEQWATALAAELGLGPDAVDVEQVLDLAADAAHGVVRPAAPVTTYLVGLAAGKAGGTDADVADAVARAEALIDRLGEE